jgi:Tol biopolymer transport system component
VRSITLGSGALLVKRWSFGLAALLAFASACDGGQGYLASLPTNSSGCISQVCSVPDGQLVFSSDRSGTNEIWTMRADGNEPRQITHDANYASWSPRLASDRRRILFLRAPRGQIGNYGQASLWIVNSDGTGLRLLRQAGRDGWAQQGHAEWSPSGQQIAMFGGANGATQIFVLDRDGVIVRQVTSRPGANIDVSWARDGSTLVFAGCPTATCTANDYEIYTVAATGGAVTRLTTNTRPDYEPFFSPDGRDVAWLQKTSDAGNGTTGTWGIKVVRIGGTERTLIDDGQVNSRPVWSTDGSRVFFHRMEPAVATRWRIFRINVDGTGLLEIAAGAPGNNAFPGT